MPENLRQNTVKLPRRKNIFSVASVLCLLFVTGCSIDRMGPAAPVINPGMQINSMIGSVIVIDGDTVQSIADRYQISAEDIIHTNNLQPPYALRGGQRLVVTYPLEYKVRGQDTLYNIARMYNIDPNLLAQHNNLAPPYHLNAGQVIRIPGLRAGQPAQIPDGFTTFSIEEAPPLEPQKLPPVEIERLNSSREKKTDVKTVVSAKNSSLTATRADIDRDKAAFAAVLDNLVKQEEAAPGIIPAAAPAARPPAKTLLGSMQKKPAAEPVAFQSMVVPSSRRGFMWPVKGNVISSYGAKPNKMFNDGVNIAAPRGTPVKAAGDGIVAYIGNDIASYGNIVLVRHDKGVMTAYAHLNNMTVKKGMRVDKGQVIGTVGSSGKVSSSQLHFEVRQGRKSVDPAKFLNATL